MSVRTMTAETWLAPLRERGLIPRDALAVFVVGSAARGWHNARSDFDIYVVASSTPVAPTRGTVPVPLEPPYLPYELFYAQDRRWDVTYWLDSQVDEVFAKVDPGSFDSPHTLDPFEELLLSRLDTCVPLLGEPWLTTARARLARSAFRSLVVVRSLGATDDAVEDALGQLEAGDLESATASARLAFGHVIDALLESHGEYGSQLPKWRPNRFRAVAPKAIGFEEFWRIETMRDHDESDPGRWITHVLTICQDLAMQVQTPWPATDGRPPAS